MDWLRFLRSSKTRMLPDSILHLLLRPPSETQTLLSSFVSIWSAGPKKWCRLAKTRDIWIFDLLSGTRTRLTFDPADDLDSVWSPDGTRIAFSSDRLGQRDIYQKLADGSGQEELLLEARADTKTSRTGRPTVSILYITTRLLH